MNKNKLKQVIGFILIFTCIFIGIGTYWLLREFGHLSIEQCLLVLTSPQEGADNSTLLRFIWQAFIPIVVSSIIVHIPVWMYAKEKVEKIKNKAVRFVMNLAGFVKKYYLSFSLCFFAITLVVGFKQYDIIDAIRFQLNPSTFLEENYVDGSTIDITFPTEKKNLILIYLESMESSFASTEHGGAYEINYIPELTKIAKNNTSFSQTNLLNGATTLTNTTWTMAAILAQNSGIPLKLTFENNEVDESSKSGYLPGAYSLGDILENEGYNQMFMCGSNAAFGGRLNYFKTHGNYQIFDYGSAKETGHIPSNYDVFWGYEDEKLFEFAKEQVTLLSQEDAPFNFTMLTVDTHFPEGYVDENNPQPYSNQYANVISFSDSQVSKFIAWAQEQPFYKDTMIVVVGDHLTMNESFVKNIDSSYNRTAYNAFINPFATTTNTTNRKFSTLDIFPTIIGGLGAKIEGNRLGLGTNLFSDELTLMDKYDISYLNEELSKKSVFYNTKIVNGQ